MSNQALCAQANSAVDEMLGTVREMLTSVDFKDADEVAATLTVWFRSPAFDQDRLRVLAAFALTRLAQSIEARPAVAP
jgi:hypothetical protein